MPPGATPVREWPVLRTRCQRRRTQYQGKRPYAPMIDEVIRPYMWPEFCFSAVEDGPGTGHALNYHLDSTHYKPAYGPWCTLPPRAEAIAPGRMVGKPELGLALILASPRV